MYAKMGGSIEKRTAIIFCVIFIRYLLCESSCKSWRYLEKNIKSEMFADYKDMVVFQNKRYVVIANGAELWYCSTTGQR